VPKGTKLVLQIRSYDATHRFDLKKPYNLKVLLPQGKTTTVEFVADTVGTFKWKCGRPCGDGCPKMTGKLTVYEPVDPTAESKED
jgi:heme/copper-type cytochrome/quinol oxidase subunit 2